MKLPIKKTVRPHPAGTTIELEAPVMPLLHNLQWEDTWDLFDHKMCEVEFVYNTEVDTEDGIATDRRRWFSDDNLESVCTGNNGW